MVEGKGFSVRIQERVNLKPLADFCKKKDEM